MADHVEETNQPQRSKLFPAGFDAAGGGGALRRLPSSLFAAWPLLHPTVDEAGSGAGRSLSAARDVAAGETLLVAEAWASAVVPEQQRRVCAVCLGRLPAATARLGKKAQRRQAAKGESAAATVAKVCACGQQHYCSEHCEGCADASWHRHYACAATLNVSDDAMASAHDKSVARLILDTILRGAFPRVDTDDGPDVATSRATWDDGVLLLQSHVQDQSSEHDADILRMVLAGLQAQAVAVVSSHKGFSIDGLRPVLLLAGVSAEEVSALISCVQCNNFGVYGGEGAHAGGSLLALALFPTAAFFNHSCRPNVLRSWDAQGRMVMKAAAAVAQGTPLTIMYGELTDASYTERQAALVAGHAFACRCERCVEEQPASIGMGH